MARARPAFRQADVTRAVKGARAAGLNIGRVEIDRDGKIVLIVGSEAPEASPEQDDLDHELEEFNARHGGNEWRR
jgi:hypothetical protein